MFISIFAASCRPQNIIDFLNNLVDTASDPQSFEVLIKLDEGDVTMISILEEYQNQAKFQLKYLATPKLDGYYTLDVGYNELLKITDTRSYFCWLLNDEIRLQTKGWDDILKKYIGIFPDDVFRIKLSIFQSKNYIDFLECLPCPDNYAVTTKKWLEITGGWGHFWGPDSWHQCIDYYLGLCKNPYYPFGIWRSFPIFDITVGGQEAGRGIDNRKAMLRRMLNIFDGWRKHSTHAAQENFYHLAQRLNAHIYATASRLEQYEIIDNPRKKTISVYPQGSNIPSAALKYKLPFLRIILMTGYKRVTIRHTVPFLFHWYRKLAYTYRTLTEMVNHAVKNPSTPKWMRYLVYQPLQHLFGLLHRMKKRFYEI